MPPAVAPDPPRQNPSGPVGAAARMANPRPGLGLAPPGADPSSAAAPPPSRRAPRLAKRRHAPASSRSRAPQATAGTWSPFGGGGTDGPRQDGNGGIGSGGGGAGSFVFGAAPAVGQQLPEPAVAAVSPSEAPFVFGSVRESLPRFEEGWSASSKLPDKMGKLNLRTRGEVGAGFRQGADKKDGGSVFGVGIPGLVPNIEVNGLPEKLTQLNLGGGAPLRSEKSESANGVPETFVFGGNGPGSFADGRNTAAIGAHPFASSSVQGTDAKSMPEKLTLFNIGNQAPSRGKGSEHTNGAPTVFMFGSSAASGHADSTKNVASGANASSSSAANCLDDASVLPEKIARLNIGSDMPLGNMKNVCTSHQPQVFIFGSGGATGAAFGNATSSTSDRSCDFFSANSHASSSSNDFLSTANSNASSSADGTENLPPEKTSDFNVGGGLMSPSMKSASASGPPEAFLFGRNRTWSSVLQSASKAMDDGGNFVNDSGTNTCTSAHGTVERTLPEKMTKLNIGSGITSESRLDETATRPPEVFVFGSNVSSFSSAQTASVSSTSFQTNASSQPKDQGRNSTNKNIRNSSNSEANSDKRYGSSNFVFGRGSNVTARFEGAAEYALHDEIKKLNISREGTSLRSTNLSDSSTHKFSFQCKADATSGYGAVPKPKVQEPCPFTNLNHSSSFSTFENAVPAFSFGTMDAERETGPDTVKQELPGCSRETLFGLDNIKSAYRDKKEAHKSTRKKKRPTRLKQHSQLHQAVSQETCINGEASDLAGDYSPMDCSPYPAAAEQGSTEAYVASDQSIHICDSSISNRNSSCAEDDLISTTEHFVIDTDLPTFRDEGRVPNVDASESNFVSSFSSFEENFSNSSQHSFTNVNIDTNDEFKMGTTEACADGYGYNVSGQACDENTYRTQHEFGEAVAFQSSSSHFSGLNFSFGASSSPRSLLSAQRRKTRRKLRTKGGSTSKSSPTCASVQLKSSQDVKVMQCFPETSKNEDPVKEQPTRDASTSAALETCETWRTSGNKAYANGHFATAEDYYTRGINSISHHGTSGHCSHALMLCYSNRAATRMSLGRMWEALQDCLIATFIDPSFLKAKVRTANCQLALGDLDGASRSYTSCLESSNTSGSDLKIFAEASDGLDRVKRVADWISQSKELLKKRTSPEAATALELISNALHISPQSDSLMEMKAEALLMLRRYEEVIQLCQESVNLTERNSVLLNANGELRNSSVSEKRQCSGRYWRSYLICKSYFLSGKLEEALDLLKKHEQVNPVKQSDESTYQERFSSLSTTIRQLLSLKAAGNESFQAGRYSEAVEQYSSALSCNSESRSFSAVCFCNRAAAYQALGQVTDAIADCSLAMVLDASYPKAISRRATLYEMIRDYGQAASDVRKLISLLEKQFNKSRVSPKVVNKHSDLKQARARLSSLEDEARKDTPLNLYLILGVEPSCSSADIKKAYRKAALKHHPDKVVQLLVRNENADDGFWRDVAKEVYADADHLFKTIGEAYNVLSHPDKRQEYDFEEDLRNAKKRAPKARSMHRSPEPNYGNKGFNPRQWQSNRGSSRRWYGYSDDYW
ncbi:uncharacterized protein LOC133885814 [Phragmites australis]|uniref:uncharacterized protein LOC133885814 n=1 Tax=Phragmites australis TaxID=29695 RepID=UPI002D79D6B6|nr:uncharacterized protein LOC133885814 [Phragmites australis]